MQGAGGGPFVARVVVELGERVRMEMCMNVCGMGWVVTRRKGWWK